MRVRDWLMPVSPVVLLGLLACGPGEFSQDSSATGAEISPAGHVSAVAAPLTVAPLLPVAGSPPAMSAAAASSTPAPEFSRIRWVSPSGSDTAAGTEAAPLRTVAKALSLLQPGEAIFLKSGTYTERLKLDARDGSADHYLTIKAAPDARPVFKGGSGSRTPMLDVRRADWRIEGLRVTHRKRDSSWARKVLDEGSEAVQALFPGRRCRGVNDVHDCCPGHVFTRGWSGYTAMWLTLSILDRLARHADGSLKGGIRVCVSGPGAPCV